MSSIRQGINKVFRRQTYQVVKPSEHSDTSPDLAIELEKYRSRDHWNRFCERLLLSSLKSLTQSVLIECDKHGIEAQEWASGVEDELRFWWDGLSRNMLAAHHEDFRREFLLDFPFQYEESLPGSAEGHVEILDMGCALKPAVGRLLNQQKLDIMAADPLACAYNTLMDIYGLERGYDLVFGVAEKTADLFGQERFDFILAQNSIDHGYDPIRSFEQICRALKVDGAARFQHFVNEAETQDYSGFHQWNIEKHSDSTLRVWNRGSSQVVDFSAYGCEVSVNEFVYERFKTEETVGINVQLKKVKSVV